MKKKTKFLQQILEYAQLELKQKKEKAKLNKQDFFGDLNDWDISEIYYNCTVKDGSLFNEKGVMLSNDGGCMDESIPYFVNQSTGYCEDDYYGTMFVSVGNNTFVAIIYSC